MVLPFPTPTFSHIHPPHCLSSNFDHLLKCPRTHEVFSWEFEPQIQYSTFPKPWGLLIHKLDLGSTLACSLRVSSVAHQTATANIWLVTQSWSSFVFWGNLKLDYVLFVAATAAHFLLLHALGMKVKPIV